VEGIVDKFDGFELEPKASAVRAMRIIPIAGMVSTFAAFMVFPLLALYSGQSYWWLAALGFLLVAAATDWILWRVSRPPRLRADSMNVSYIAPFKTSTVPRAEISLIYLGQVVQRGRYTAWVQSYVFAVSGGTVQFAVPAFWFDADAIKDFARRLGVPVRGDFTQRVRGTVDENAT
jgi:hypothetical protein